MNEGLFPIKFSGPVPHWTAVLGLIVRYIGEAGSGAELHELGSDAVDVSYRRPHVAAAPELPRAQGEEQEAKRVCYVGMAWDRDERSADLYLYLGLTLRNTQSQQRLGRLEREAVADEDLAAAERQATGAGGANPFFQSGM
jgi:hypothetical protein